MTLLKPTEKPTIFCKKITEKAAIMKLRPQHHQSNFRRLVPYFLSVC